MDIKEFLSGSLSKEMCEGVQSSVLLPLRRKSHLGGLRGGSVAFSLLLSEVSDIILMDCV